MIDRGTFREIDWILIGLLIVNSVIGVIFIYSSSHFLPGNFAVKQVIFIVVSLALLFLLLAVDYKVLITYSLYFYLAVMVVLAGLLLFARLVAHTKSWIKLPFFQVQPSELAKIALILLLARIFSGYKKSTLSSNVGVQAILIVLGPFILVAAQPDLGTALTFVSVLLAALILAGLRKKTIAILLVVSLAVGLIGWNFALKDYQKKRLTTLFYPRQDPRGAGYHILQSKIAIGSGGLTGKGFLKGSQSQLRFLPARHTDFIFSVIGEEFGFLGVFFVMLSYFLMLARMFFSVGMARDRAGVYIIFMASMLIAFQFFVNILMIIGLFPVTGVPLPLLSYGGSSLVSNSLAVGLVINVRMRRFANV
jgi:rod shape determining protein RodA